MPICQNCDNHVSSAFARVFSPNSESTVESCHECAPEGQIVGGDVL